MNPVAKILIFGGVVLIVVGLLWQVGGKYLNLAACRGHCGGSGKISNFIFPS